MITKFKITIQCFFICLFFTTCKAQTVQNISVSEMEVSRILYTLAADSMQGRNSLVAADINRAAYFISEEFKKLGLSYFDNNTSYLQPFEHTYDGKNYIFNNIIGIIPGKSKAEEYVVFSAHYDHIGVLDAIEQDSVANGADDNASGTTAVIELAKHFSKIKDNERTLIFVAFTAEELGGTGSAYFAEHINTENVAAMINIEMIGKASKFGKNTAFITGYQYSDLGKILQENLKNTIYHIYPDPYPRQQLFFRSDNKSLAQKGVAAHTISTVQIDKDDTYHTVKDEVKNLDIKNIIAVIKMIAVGSESIISGKNTPSRIQIK